MRGEGGGCLNKRWSPTDNLNINKRRSPNKREGLKVVLRQKWQPVLINYGDCFGKFQSVRGVSQQAAFMGS